MSTKQYNKTRIYHLSTFQVSCNYLVYFLRSNQLYTCITTFYLQDFDIFDGAIKKTITKLPQHPFSNLYKTIFPRLKMVIVYNPIQNKWFSNLNYLSKQIYVGVIWKSDVNMPFVVISTNRKAVFEDFYRSQNLKCCLISKSHVVFLVYICLFSQKTEDYATKEYNHWYISHGKVLKRVFSLVAILE